MSPSRLTTTGRFKIILTDRDAKMNLHPKQGWHVKKFPPRCASIALVVIVSASLSPP
jgi:hypothetical protein